MEKVAIFIPTLSAGGAERVASILANSWSDIRNVTLITFFDVPHFYHIDSKVTVECLGYKSERRLIPRTFDISNAILNFRDRVRKLNPSFLLSFMNKYNAFALGSLYGTGTPVVVSERDSPVEKLPYLRVFFRNLLYPNAAGLICQTKAYEEFIRKKILLKKTIVIPNPISTITQPLQRLPEDIILAVGRLERKKGFDQLLKAFSAMKNKQWRLEICGNGPLLPDLQNLACCLEIENRVTFCGVVRDLTPYFRRAGLFAFTSIYEGFPNALAEAFVSGIPCVSYDCPTGPAEIITNGVNGRLVNVGDWLSFAESLDELAIDSNKRKIYSEKAFLSRSRFDLEAIAFEYLAFCESTFIR